jgi:hypothetical protein
MNGFYELIPDVFHLNEYHEYYFFTKIHGLRDNQIRQLEEYEHFDMRLYPFIGSEDIKKDAESNKYHMIYPEYMYFTGDFYNSKIERTDYPIIDGYQLLVLNKKLMAVIDSIRQFKRDIVQTIIFDFLEENPFIENNILKKGVKQTADYVYLKLFQFVMIDKENTHHYIGNTNHQWNSDISIIRPEEGLDPIFRIRQLPERVFITEDTYNAIEDYNKKTEDKIKGIKIYDGYHLVNSI